MTQRRIRKNDPEVGARQAEALTLRATGMTYERISQELDYRAPSSAFRAVESAVKKTLQEPADELRTLELARLDSLQSGLWDKAMGGNLKAVDRVLRIMARRAALLGLDAPIKKEITGDVTLRGFAENAALAAGLDPALVLAEAARILSEGMDSV